MAKHEYAWRSYLPNVTLKALSQKLISMALFSTFRLLNIDSFLLFHYRFPTLHSIFMTSELVKSGSVY